MKKLSKTQIDALKLARDHGPLEMTLRKGHSYFVSHGHGNAPTVSVEALRSRGFVNIAHSYRLGEGKIRCIRASITAAGHRALEEQS